MVLEKKKEEIVMIKDFLPYVVNSIMRRKIRSSLTIIGIFIGIAAVIALISIGQGMKEEINRQFEKLGTNKITIQPGAVQFGPPGSSVTSAKLTENDVDFVKKIRGVDIAVGLIYKIGKVKSNNEVKYHWVAGVPIDETKEIINDMRGYEILSGRDFRKTDSSKVIVGYSLAHDDAFKKEVKIGDVIEIEDKSFKVIGIMDKTGNPYDDSSVVIPIDDAKEIFGSGNEVSMIFLRVKNNEVTANVAEEIKKKLKDRIKGVEVALFLVLCRLC